MSWNWTIGALVVFLLSGCGVETAPSRSQDIFRSDRTSDRRDQASPEERLWTVEAGGCTGSLVAPEYLLTAAHCDPRNRQRPQPWVGSRFTSGAALNEGRRQDLTVAEVEEINRRLDYAVLRVRWRGARPKDQKFPPRIATSPSQVRLSPNPGQGDKVFTVGFPGDRRSRGGSVTPGSATYSEGRLKRISQGRQRQGPNRGEVLHNIGIINGNSGGAVWRKKDHMLISMTNAGPHRLGEFGWTGNSKTDSSHWNWGAGIWDVYQDSQTLQQIFPNGKNRHGGSGTRSSDFTKDLFLALAPGGNSEGLTIWLSSTGKVERVHLCEGGRVAACGEDEQWTEVEYVTSRNGRRFYKSTDDLSLQNEKILTAAGYAADGELVSGNTVEALAVAPI